MYTVYGIYVGGVILYVGSTGKSLRARFNQHIASRIMETPTHDQNPIVATRRKLFQRHSAGEIKLEINPISYHETKEDALKNEYAAIAEHRPPYNSFTGPKPIPAPKAKPNRIDSGSLYINFKFANEEVKATALSCMMEAGVTNLTAYINALIVEDVKNNP